MYKLKSESGQFGESVRQFYSRDQERDPQHHQHGKGRLHMCRLHHRYVDVSCRRPLHGVDDPLYWQALATPQVVRCSSKWSLISKIFNLYYREILLDVHSVRCFPASHFGKNISIGLDTMIEELGLDGNQWELFSVQQGGKRSQSGWLLSFGAFTFLVPPCYQCNFLSNFLCHLKYHMTNITKKERK